jgi:cyclophilin family peptidyl-prolyl cis-trans isomerase
LNETKDKSLKYRGAVGPQVPMKFASNPVVYFDIEIDNEQRGRLVMELFRHVLPRTAQNFLSLTLNEHGFGYRLSYFHRIIPGFMAQAGDFEKSNGTGGYSIYEEKFDDEGFPYAHDRAGLLSMANSGPNTNGSQFFITFDACPHLDNKHVVFGQILQGFHLLKDLDMSGSDSGEVLREVKISATGQLK